jgi:hypothetical protein
MVKMHEKRPISRPSHLPPFFPPFRIRTREDEKNTASAEEEADHLPPPQFMAMAVAVAAVDGHGCFC